MEQPTDKSPAATESWLNLIANPVLTNILLLILIAALGLDISMRSTVVTNYVRDRRLEVQLTPPPVTIRGPGSIAIKGVVNGPTASPATGNTLSPPNSKKKIHDRVAPGP